MAKTTVTCKLDPDLVAWLDEYAEANGLSRSGAVEEAVLALKSPGGAPVLKPPPRFAPKGDNCPTHKNFVRSGQQCLTPGCTWRAR